MDRARRDGKVPLKVSAGFSGTAPSARKAKTLEHFTSIFIAYSAHHTGANCHFFLKHD